MKCTYALIIFSYFSYPITLIIALLSLLFIKLCSKTGTLGSILSGLSGFDLSVACNLAADFRPNVQLLFLTLGFM